MSSISVNDAQLQLPDLIRQLVPGEELILTENNLPVARLISTTPPQRPRQLGSMRGTVLNVAPDFDAPLDEFREYMK